MPDTATSDIATHDFSEMDNAAISSHHWKIMLISGMGFFTDAYDLFIIGVVMSLVKPIWHVGKFEESLVDLSQRTRSCMAGNAGEPNRSWFKHTIYAPGEYTGYAAVVIPGVNEAVDAKDPMRGQSQLAALTAALNRAAATLEGVAK